MKKTQKENLQFAGAIFLAVALVATIAYSKNSKAEVECRANVKVLKGGQPVLKPVKLSITNQRTGELITSTIAHQLSTIINCGIRYEVSSDIDGFVKKQIFDVAVGSVTTITINY